MKNKNLPLLLSLLFLLASAIVIYLLYNKVSEENSKQLEITKQEDAIKRKLSLYGQLQKLYFNQQPENNKTFVSEWKAFKNFVETGKIYTIERKETVKELSLGKDTIIFSYDTINVVSIMDSIWNKTEFEMRTFEYVPDEINPRKFDLRAGTFEGRAVFEIKDTAPINPTRISGEQDTLKVGSMISPTTEGNWR